MRPRKKTRTNKKINKKTLVKEKDLGEIDAPKKKAKGRHPHENELTGIHEIVNSIHELQNQLKTELHLLRKKCGILPCQYGLDSESLVMWVKSVQTPAGIREKPIEFEEK